MRNQAVKCLRAGQHMCQVILAFGIDALDPVGVDGEAMSPHVALQLVDKIVAERALQAVIAVFANGLGDGVVIGR
jgi:hypothetical protein